MNELPENIALAKAFSKDLPKHQASYIQELEAKTEQLQAENATLKAHNRQMVEFLEWLETEDIAVCRDTLETPPAKLALAEAEVLRVAEEWRNSDKVGIESVETLLEAVEAMQEARNGSDT